MKEAIQKTYLYHHVGKHKLTYLKLFGSIIVILSGFVPFTDNIWSWIDPAFDAMKDARGVKLRSDVWIESLYVSIVLCSIGRFMRAYSICYFLPIYASLYSLSMYELMRFGYDIDPDWLHRIGFIFMLLPLYYVVYRLINYIKDLKLKDEIQSKTIDRIVQQNQMKENENK